MAWISSGVLSGPYGRDSSFIARVPFALAGSCDDNTLREPEDAGRRHSPLGVRSKCSVRQSPTPLKPALAPAHVEEPAHRPRELDIDDRLDLVVHHDLLQRPDEPRVDPSREALDVEPHQVRS